MDAALLAEGVRRSYGGTVALDGVSLSVDAGEVFGLVGPNGAGKTTLVRALTGTTRPDAGTVRVLGEPPTAVDPGRIGLLPQSFDPPERLTARELVDYYGGLYETARATDAVLADVGMTGDADSWYENLSGGQRRRTCVATALVNDPDVLFLDEPTTGIDPAGRRALWDVLEGLAAGGTTVFLTSHSMTEIRRLSDRVGLLRRGELVAVGDPAGLIAEYGGESRLVVSTTASADAAARALTEQGVRADAEDGELVIRGVAPTGIGDAVRALEAADVAYESLAWKQPDLEDVYLRLTGERVGPGGERRREEPGAAGSGAGRPPGAVQSGPADPGGEG